MTQIPSFEIEIASILSKSLEKILQKIRSGSLFLPSHLLSPPLKSNNKEEDEINEFLLAEVLLEVRPNNLLSNTSIGKSPIINRKNSLRLPKIDEHRSKSSISSTLKKKESSKTIDYSTKRNFFSEKKGLLSIESLPKIGEKKPSKFFQCSFYKEKEICKVKLAQKRLIPIGKFNGESRKLGLENLSYSKRVGREKRKYLSEKQREKNGNTSLYNTKDNSNENTPLYDTKVASNGQIPLYNKRNYLKECFKDGGRLPLEGWKRDINDRSLNQKDRFELVKRKAGALDQDSMRKEQYLKYYKRDYEIREKMNDMLYNSISAKISLLKEL